MSDTQPEVLSDAEVLQIKKDREATKRRTDLQRARRNAKRAAKLVLSDPTALTDKRISRGLAPDATNKYFKSLLLEQLARIEVGHTLSNAERIVQKVIEMALSGREMAIEIVMNRVDGKVLQQEPSNSNGSSGLTILVGPNSQVLVAPEPDALLAPKPKATTEVAEVTSDTKKAIPAPIAPAATEPCATEPCEPADLSST